MLSDHGLYCDQCESLPDLLVTFYTEERKGTAYRFGNKWNGDTSAGWWELCFYCALTFVPPIEFIVSHIKLTHQGIKFRSRKTNLTVRKSNPTQDIEANL